MVSFCHSIYIEDLSKTSLRPRDISRASSTKIRQMVIKLHDGTPAALMTLSDTDRQFLQGKQANKTFIFTERSRKEAGDIVYLGGGGAFLRISNAAAESDHESSGDLNMKLSRLSWSRCSRERTRRENIDTALMIAVMFSNLASSGKVFPPPTRFSHKRLPF